MKKVEEMCAKLGSASGTPIKQSDVLMIGINGTKSKLPLSEFVKGYSHSESEIRGYSILLERKTELVDNRIKLNDDILISLFRQSDEEEIVIAKIFPHWFQGADKEVDNDLHMQILREELIRITSEVMEEVKEEIAAPTEESVAEETVVQETATEDGYKSNSHKAVCLLGLEACDLKKKDGKDLRFSTDQVVFDDSILSKIESSLKPNGRVFEMESSSEEFKIIKQKAKAAAKDLGASEPVQFKCSQEVHEFLTVLLEPAAVS